MCVVGITISATQSYVFPVGMQATGRDSDDNDRKRLCPSRCGGLLSGTMMCKKFEARMWKKFEKIKKKNRKKQNSKKKKREATCVPAIWQRFESVVDTAF